MKKQSHTMKKQSYLEQEIPFVDRKDQSKAETEDEDTTIKEFTFDRQVAFCIFASYAAYISVGMCSSTEGPSLPELEIFFQTTTSKISFGLASCSLGFLAGSLLAGVLVERLSYEFQIAADTVSLGISVVLPPFSGSLEGFIGTMVLKGIALGYHNVVAQTFILYTLLGSRFSGSFVQGLHLVWSGGSALAPIIMQPFISKDTQMLTRNYMQDSENSSTQNVINSTTLAPVELGLFNGPKIGTAFLIFGGITLVSSVPMWCLVVKIRNTLFRRIVHSHSKESSGTYQKGSFSRRTKILFLCIIFIWCHQFLIAETLISAFLSTWAIKGLNWSIKEGAKLTTVLWASHCSGRIIAIPLAAILSPRILLMSGILLTTVSFVTLACLHHIHVAVTWTCVVGLGLGMASPMGALLQWFSRLIRLTGGMSSIFIAGVATGRLTSPIITGFLMDKYSPHWMIYIGIVGSGSMLILFAMLELIVKFWYKERLGQNEK